MSDRNMLVGGGVVALLLTTALAVFFLLIPLISPESRTTWAQAGLLCGMASVGIVSSGVTLQSARHGGRWGWVGFVLSVVYLAGPWITPYFIGVVHWIILPAGFVFALAMANTLSPRPRK